MGLFSKTCTSWPKDAYLDPLPSVLADSKCAAPATMFSRAMLRVLEMDSANCMRRGVRRNRVRRDFGTPGPLASECISRSPGIRIGRIEECNSCTTYIRSELIIYSFELLLIYVTNSSPTCLPTSSPACLVSCLVSCLAASLPCCLAASLPRCLPACMTACLPRRLYA